MDRNLLIAATATVVIAALQEDEKKECRRRKRGCWMRPWLQRREEGRGIYGMLMRELRPEDPDEFRNFVRMDKTCFDKLLSLIKNRISHTDTVMRESISPSRRLAVTLRFLATGETYKSLSFAHRISVPSMSHIVVEVCTAILATLKDKYLKAPTTEKEWEEIAAKFDELWQFPNCLGAMDGKHIAFAAPRSAGALYYNYKKFHSIVLLAVVDATYRFRLTDIGCNGRISDGESSTMSATSQAKDTTSMDVGKVLDVGDGTMVTLEAGDTRLPVHRAVLSARSPVFAAMFRHNTLEAISGHVSITDVEGPVLRQLLAYCYTLQVPQLPGVAFQLLAAADKYGLTDLKDACEQQVVRQLTIENAAAAAVLALSHSCHRLKRAAMAFIMAHTRQVIMTQAWEDAFFSHPYSALELTRLITDPHAKLWCLSAEEGARRLIQSAEQGAVEEVQALLATGVDVGATGETGWTALHCAADRGHLEVARRLVRGGAQVDARTSAHSTPLHLAAWSGHTALVQLLLAASADPNARDSYGRRPLHWAAWNGQGEIAAALLEMGADKAASDVRGNTPLDIARQNKKQQLVLMLT